ncbi:MAG: alpha/beta hydrolase [Archangium sp.]|nr:alpha/beta hydrolase [Archangium sp.]
MTRTLFLHSTGTGPFLWDSVPEEVVPSSERVTPSNLGYPPGEPTPRGQTVSVADDASHVFPQLPEGDFNLVAHSYGGLLALHLLPALGPRVRSLCLFEPVLFGALADDDASPADAVAQAREFRGHEWFLTDVERGGTEPWLEVFIDYWNRPGSWKRLPELMRHHNLQLGWKMFQEVRAVFFDARTFDAWPLPRVPVTLVKGERSPVASRAMIDALAKRNAHARVVELAGTGHMAPLTHPAKVHEALAVHLATARES